MNGFDPFVLAPPPRPTEEITLSDGSLNLTICLRSLDLVETMAAQELADRILTQFGHDFPPAGGESVALSRTLAEAAAGLSLMQVRAEGSRNLSAEEWIALAKTRPQMFHQALEAGRRLNRKSKLGKAPARHSLKGQPVCP